MCRFRRHSSAHGDPSRRRPLCRRCSHSANCGVFPVPICCSPLFSAWKSNAGSAMPSRGITMRAAGTSLPHADSSDRRRRRQAIGPQRRTNDLGNRECGDAIVRARGMPWDCRRECLVLETPRVRDCGRGASRATRFQGARSADRRTAGLLCRYGHAARLGRAVRRTRPKLGTLAECVQALSRRGRCPSRDRRCAGTARGARN